MRKSFGAASFRIIEPRKMPLETHLREFSSTNRRIIIALALAGLVQGILGFPQDIVGGASALAGQDIIGGASVIFKRPPRVRDLAGGASLLIVKHRAPRKPAEPVQIARNNPKPKRTPPGQPESNASRPQASAEDKAEAYNNQGNTFYDVGQYAKAVEAYKKALGFKPNDALTYNNLAAAYFAMGQSKDAIEAFQQAVKIKPDDPDTQYHPGASYKST